MYISWVFLLNFTQTDKPSSKVRHRVTSQLIIDQSFAKEVLRFLSSSSSLHFEDLLQNPAAQYVHAHAVRYRNTDKMLKDFWQNILHRETQRGSTHRDYIKASIEYIDQHRNIFEAAFTEVQEYLPAAISSEFSLHTMIGYDIGIVINGHALLNLAHPLFHQHPRELIYFAMHELHHVGYTAFHPPFAFDDLHSTKHLLDAIYYSTHLEGMAVFTSLSRRLQENGLHHEDYPILLDPKQREIRIREYFTLLNSLIHESPRPLMPQDFEIFEVMSGSPKRLWYITGAHMAQTIDELYGRNQLLQTVIDGPTSFFSVYQAAQKEN